MRGGRGIREREAGAPAVAAAGVNNQRAPRTVTLPHRGGQARDPQAPEPRERHETPIPPRSGALEARFHSVWRRAGQAASVLESRGHVFLEFAPIGDIENPVGNEFMAVAQILL